MHFLGVMEHQILGCGSPVLDLGCGSGLFGWLHDRMFYVPKVGRLVARGVHLRRLLLVVAGRLVSILMVVRLVTWIAFASAVASGLLCISSPIPGC